MLGTPHSKDAEEHLEGLSFLSVTSTGDECSAGGKESRPENKSTAGLGSGDLEAAGDFESVGHLQEALFVKMFSQKLHTHGE